MSDINKMLIGAATDIGSAKNFFLQKFFPEQELEAEYVQPSNRQCSSLVLMDDGSYLSAYSNTQVAFQNATEPSNSWIYTIYNHVNATCNGACYNPISDSFIVTNYTFVASIDRLTGTENWKVEPGAEFCNDCAVDEDGNIYVAMGVAGNGILRKLSWIDGSEIWSKIPFSGRCYGVDAGNIGTFHGVVVCGMGDGGSNIAAYTKEGVLQWIRTVPSFEYGILQDMDLGTCKIYGESRDVLVGGHRQDPGAQKSLWRLNGGSGAVIWSLDLGHDVQPLSGSSPYISYGKCIDYDDQGNIWCGVVRNSSGGTPANLVKISSAGSVLSRYNLGGEGLDVGTGNLETCCHVAVQINEGITSSTTTQEPSTTTQEPFPCEVSNLFEYGYLKKDGITILIRKTTGNVLQLIRPMPPEWIVGSEITLVPGCNKTLCDCLYKWNNINEFLGLGVKMPSANLLAADQGATPG